MYFIIFLLIVIICWPWISRFIRRKAGEYMARKQEDLLRRMMGMPPRDRKAQKKSSGRSHAWGAKSSSGPDPDPFTSDNGKGTKRHRGSNRSIAALMQLVAVDVTFTEVREFASTTIGKDGGASISYTVEEQISDVKFTEIKGPR